MLYGVRRFFMKTKHFRKLILWIVLTVASAFVPISYAIATEIINPQIVIKNSSNKLKLKLEDGNFIHDFHQVNAFVDEVIDPHVDFKRISALVLGKLWRKATKDEKKQFTKEFKILLIRAYSRVFVGFKDWSIRFFPVNMKEGTKKIIVKTEILQHGIQPIALNYRMILSKDQWKMYDIMIEGVSLVTNYRTSIKNEFRKIGTIRGIIDKLTERNITALSKIDNP